MFSPLNEERKELQSGFDANKSYCNVNIAFKNTLITTSTICFCDPQSFQKLHY